MNALIPRDYQAAAILSPWEYFEKGGVGNPLIAMPTGTGKSIVIAGFLQSVYARFGSQRIIMLTHIKELIVQNYEKLLQLWPTAPVGIYSSGLKQRDTQSAIVFAGIASVAKRAVEFGHIDLIIIDEAHLVSPNDNTMYRTFINALTQMNPYLKVIGLTATKYRLGQGLLTEEGGLFTDVCFDMTTLDCFNWLIDENYILPLVPKKTTAFLDIDGVNMRGGEFLSTQLQQAVDRSEVTERILREAVELGHDRHSWLVFATGIDHAVHSYEMLNDMGIPTGVVHSGNKQYKSSAKIRDKSISDFRSCKTRALVNNGVLTTGFDHPQLDLIVMMRPTASPGLWVQMLGRGTRPCYAEGFDLATTSGRGQAIANSQKQNCLVLDFARNTARLGPINDPVLPKKKGSKGGSAPVKACDNCEIYIHASLRVCPHCGYQFPVKTKIFEGASTGELIKRDLPVVEEFKVNTIMYALHCKKDRPDMVKVNYYCGFNSFTEYVCPQHEGFAGRKARDWCHIRGMYATDMPETAEELLEKSGKLKVATSLRIWVNKKHPEIMAHCFDGTHFGREAPQLEKPAVLETVKQKYSIPSAKPLIDINELDDIPF
jgi:DNA repair protein RadD